MSELKKDAQYGRFAFDNFALVRPPPISRTQSDFLETLE
jgi:hypothetical protein